MISFSQIESWSCNGTESVNSDLVLYPLCRTEMIFTSNLRATFCAKHDFTVTKLLCKNVIEAFNSEDFFSILVTNYFSILKQFSLFRNIFLDFKFFFLDSVIVFLISFFFFFDSEIFLWISKLFSWFWKFLSIMKVFSRWRLSATIVQNWHKRLEWKLTNFIANLNEI